MLNSFVVKRLKILNIPYFSKFMNLVKAFEKLPASFEMPSNNCSWIASRNVQHLGPSFYPSLSDEHTCKVSLSDVTNSMKPFFSPIRLTKLLLPDPRYR